MLLLGLKLVNIRWLVGVFGFWVQQWCLVMNSSVCIMLNVSWLSMCWCYGCCLSVWVLSVWLLCCIRVFRCLCNCEVKCWLVVMMLVLCVSSKDNGFRLVEFIVVQCWFIIVIFVCSVLGVYLWILMLVFNKCWYIGCVVWYCRKCLYCFCSNSCICILCVVVIVSVWCSLCLGMKYVLMIMIFCCVLLMVLRQVCLMLCWWLMLLCSSRQVWVLFILKWKVFLFVLGSGLLWLEVDLLCVLNFCSRCEKLFIGRVLCSVFQVVMNFCWCVLCIVCSCYQSCFMVFIMLVISGLVMCSE